MFNCVNFCSNAARVFVGAVGSGVGNGCLSAFTSYIGGGLFTQNEEQASAAAIGALAGNAFIGAISGGVGAVLKADEHLLKLRDSSITVKLTSIVVLAGLHTASAAIGGLMTSSEAAATNASNAAIANSIGVLFSAGAALAVYGIHRCVKRCKDGANEFKGLIGEPARSRRRGK